MKTTRLSFAILLLFLLSAVSFYGQALKKRITNTEFRYEFFTDLEIPTIKPDRTYYWFKAGAIHNSESGASGEVLEGLFEKYYLSNQLAEKGVFRDGLKVGEWKSWYASGKLAEVSEYRDGRRYGNYSVYSPDGTLIEKGNFKQGEKHGTWINYTRKDTLYFKKGTTAVKKSWIKDIFTKKTPEQKEQLKLKRENKKAQSKAKSDARKQEKAQRQEQKKSKADARVNPDQNTKEKNFFQRLFSRKPKQNDKSP